MTKNQMQTLQQQKREASDGKMQCTSTEKQTQNNTEMAEVSDSDTMIVTGEERPGHRVLTDDVIGLCVCSNTSTLEVAVRPKRDMDAEQLIDNEIANEAVRPKRDMDAEEPIDNEIEKDAVRRKSDMDAEKSAETENENDGQQKKTLEENL